MGHFPPVRPNCRLEDHDVSEQNTSTNYLVVSGTLVMEMAGVPIHYILFLPNIIIITIIVNYFTPDSLHGRPNPPRTRNRFP